MPVGTAYFTIPLAKRYDGLVVGVDIAAGMVDEAAAAARSAGADNLSMVQGNAHSLPFGDASFGAILCTNGLQVMPGLEPAVVEMERVLEPGGSLFVSVVTLPLGRMLPAERSIAAPHDAPFRDGRSRGDIEGRHLRHVDPPRTLRNTDRSREAPPLTADLASEGYPLGGICCTIQRLPSGSLK